MPTTTLTNIMKESEAYQVARFMAWQEKAGLYPPKPVTHVARLVADTTIPTTDLRASNG